MITGHANAQCNPASRAARTRRKFSSVCRSRIQPGLPLAHTRPGRPTPLSNVCPRLAAPKRDSVSSGRCHWARHTSRFAGLLGNPEEAGIPRQVLADRAQDAGRCLVHAGRLVQHVRDGQPRIAMLFLAPLFHRAAKDQHDAEHDARGIPDRRGASRRSPARCRPSQQHGVVDDPALAQHPVHRVVDRLPGCLVDDAEHRCQGSVRRRRPGSSRSVPRRRRSAMSPCRRCPWR